MSKLTNDDKELLRTILSVQSDLRSLSQRGVSPKNLTRSTMAEWTFHMRHEVNVIAGMLHQRYGKPHRKWLDMIADAIMSDRPYLMLEFWLAMKGCRADSKEERQVLLDKAMAVVVDRSAYTGFSMMRKLKIPMGLIKDAYDGPMRERMIEYAKGIIDKKQGKPKQTPTAGETNPDW